MQKYRFTPHTPHKEERQKMAIARNIQITNKCSNSIFLQKAMSMQLEITNKNYELINLYGGWGFEGQKNKIELGKGIYINDSKTGNSSNRHNPFFMLKEKTATYNNGDVYSFNLVYSGNHYEMVEVSSFNKVRIQTGINPYCFKYESISYPLSLLLEEVLLLTPASELFLFIPYFFIYSSKL